MWAARQARSLLSSILSPSSTALSRALLPSSTAAVQTTVPSRGHRIDRSDYHERPGRNISGLWKQHDRGPYISFYSRHGGKRRELARAADRFKRLDWGALIRPVGGHGTKHWMKRGARNWRQEQHVFLGKSNAYIVQRLLLPETKAKRYLPDDIYEKYHRTSFFKHRWLKIKNRENVKQSGSEVHRFTRYKAALSKKETKYNLPERGHYLPPGFLGNTAAHGGVYKPDAEFVPENTPAPYIERPPVRANKLMEDKILYKLKRLETFSGGLEPWNPLRKGFFKRV